MSLPVLFKQHLRARKQHDRFQSPSVDALRGSDRVACELDADAGEPTQHRYRQNDSDIEMGRDAGRDSARWRGMARATSSRSRRPRARPSSTHGTQGPPREPALAEPNCGPPRPPTRWSGPPQAPEGMVVACRALRPGTRRAQLFRQFCRASRAAGYHLPVLAMEAQGSCLGSDSPFCKSSMEILSGERTKAMRPSRGGRLMVTPDFIKRSQVA